MLLWTLDLYYNYWDLARTCLLLGVFRGACKVTVRRMGAIWSPLLLDTVVTSSVWCIYTVCRSFQLNFASQLTASSQLYVYLTRASVRGRYGVHK